MKVNKDEIYLIKGDALISFKKGIFEVVGAYIYGGNLHIPNGKQVPIIVREDGELNVNGKKVEKLNQSTIPDTWYKISEQVIEKNIKKVLILGEVDTGKSFFTTFLSNQLRNKKRSVGVIDSDTGQTDIGAPGTIGFGIFDKYYINLSDVPVNKQYFIGSLSPGGFFSIFLTGISQLLHYSLKQVDTVIVDTTGWVHGDGGRSIKRAKIDIIQPDLIILLQREKELEHLVQHYNPEKIIRLKVSKKASNTSQEMRKQLRENISKEYFENGITITLPLDSILFDRTYTKSGEELKNNNLDILFLEKLPAWEGYIIVFPDNIEEKRKLLILKDYPKAKWYSPHYLKGIFVGLSDKDGFCNSVGIIENIDFLKRSISIYTGKNDCNIKNIHSIQFGSIRYTKSGLESGFVIPGTI